MRFLPLIFDPPAGTPIVAGSGPITPILVGAGRAYPHARNEAVERPENAA
jgi:hypothetical protein